MILSFEPSAIFLTSVLVLSSSLANFVRIVNITRSKNGCKWTSISFQLIEFVCFLRPRPISWKKKWKQSLRRLLLLFTESYLWVFTSLSVFLWSLCLNQLLLLLFLLVSTEADFDVRLVHLHLHFLVYKSASSGKRFYITSRDEWACSKLTLGNKHKNFHENLTNEQKRVHCLWFKTFDSLSSSTWTKVEIQLTKFTNEGCCSTTGL